jgi:ppGpp synthetase/RelA/SpoT-type nucleotidyltranferase
MHLADDFIARYSREYDYYDRSARLCAQKCETDLGQLGIRAIVTCRAKRPDRLRGKIEKLNRRQEFHSIEEIYERMPDLAGTRIALYFPGDFEAVDGFIKANFEVERTKSFPVVGAPPLSNYKTRFAGYCANHYHVSLQEDALPDVDKRYAHTRIEIQVASVLMHAWSEVEHDLVYKPFSGELSDMEHAILDELNGLVLAGEIALEQLQRAVRTRVSKRGKPFGDHYELAAFLSEAVKAARPEGGTPPAMGRADILLRFLQLAGLDCPEKLSPLLSDLRIHEGSKPMVEEMVDRLLLRDPQLHPLYAQARQEVAALNPYSATDEDRRNKPVEDRAVRHFLSRWIAFETAVTEAVRVAHPEMEGKTGVMSTEVLKRLDLPVEDWQEIDRLRRLRNQVVHGIGFPGSEYLIRSGDHLERLLRKWETVAPEAWRGFIAAALKGIESGTTK